ncbi:MAG: hypothetical protein AB7E46_07220 [Desulfovibrio sp.]
MNLLRAFNAAPAPTESHTALVLAAFIALVVFQSIALAKGQEFSASAFGEALGIILGGGGVAALGQSYLTRARGQLAGGNVRPADPDK